MIKVLTIVFSVLYIVSCNSETATANKDHPEISPIQLDPNDLKKDELKGKVSQVIIALYEPIMKDGQTQKGELTSTQIISYDQNGNMLLDKYFRGDGKFLDSTFYKRNSAGKLIEEHQYDSELPDVKIIYSYNEAGKIASDVAYVSGKIDGKSVYTYYPNGLVKKRLSYDSGGDFSSSDDYKYDENGHLIKYGYEGGFSYVEHYSYDESGNRVVREHGNNVEENGSGSYHYVKEMYDQDSNWTKCVEYDDSDRPIWYTERVIKYY